MNKMGSPVDLLKWQRQNAVYPQQASLLSPEERKKKFLIGELHHHEAPEYTESYAKLVESARRQNDDGSAA
jgi:2-oxoglutarate ferredoxin oxidoreductase subunit beta